MASVHPDFSADGTMMLGSTLTAAVIQVPLNTVTLQCLTASSTPKLTCPGKEKVFSLLKKQLWCWGGRDGWTERQTYQGDQNDVQSRVCCESIFLSLRRGSVFNNLFLAISQASSPFSPPFIDDEFHFCKGKKKCFRLTTS